MFKLVSQQTRRPSGMTRVLADAESTSANDTFFEAGFVFQDHVDVDALLAELQVRLNPVDWLFLNLPLIETAIGLEIHKCMDAFGIKRFKPKGGDRYSAMQRIALFEESRKRKMVFETRAFKSAILRLVQQTRKVSLHEGQRTTRLELRKSVCRDFPLVEYMDLKRLCEQACQVLSPRQRLQLGLAELSKAMAKVVVSTLQAASEALFNEHNEAIIASLLLDLRCTQALTHNGPNNAPVRLKPVAAPTPRPNLPPEGQRGPRVETSLEYSLATRKIVLPEPSGLGGWHPIGSLRGWLNTALGLLRPTTVFSS